MSSLLLEILGGLVDLLNLSPRKNDRRTEWSGTVEAKKTLTLSKRAYLVVFRTDGGRKKKVRMDRKEEFDSYEEGRKYHKRAGQDLPDIPPGEERPKIR